MQIAVPSATITVRRRPDLDWIRVGAFGLLIFYHVGMAFVTWDWHVKTAHPSPALEPFMVLLNPWRLSLLFFVSGCATRFMADRLAPRALARARLIRLGLPLLFGILVVVPPQSWVQVQEHGYRLGYLAFYGRYLMADHSFCDAHGCLLVPTWNHLWFLAYLLTYTLGLLAVIASAPRLMQRLGQLASPMMDGCGALLWPALWLVFVRQVLAPRFEETHALWGDWYAHSVYACVFLLGFGLARSASFWAAVQRLRWPALAAALLTGASFALYVHAYPGDAEPPISLRRVMRCVYGVDQWASIVAILAFARRHLTRGSPMLTYLTQGLFTFYIVHQTIIVLAEFWLKRLHWPAPAEGSVLVLTTMFGCWASYEGVRRTPVLQPVFGLRTRPMGQALAAE